VPLNIKNPDTEGAVRDLARLTGESQAEAVLIAVRERMERLNRDDRRARLAHRLARAQAAYALAGASLDADALYDARGLPA